MLAAGSIQFSTAAFSVADSAGTVSIIMTRTGGSTGAVSIKLATSDGTAISGTDYNAVSGSIGFPDGITTETLKLAVLPDPVANLPGRSVFLTLSNPLGGATLGTSAAVLTITHVAVAGDLDGTFGTNGRVDATPGPTNLPSGEYALPIGPFLIATDGSSYGISELYAASSTVYVNKFNPDGTPDTSYGTDGVASVDVGSNGLFILGASCDAVFQTDGKVVIAGFNESSNNLVLVRLNTDGSPDLTFGQNGVALLALPTSTTQSGGIAVLTGGQIVVGFPNYIGMNGFATVGFDLAAFASDGTPMLTFGTSGFAAVTPVSQSGAASIAGPGQILAMPDGTFVVADTLGSVPGGDLQRALLRYNADGSLDTAFGSGGLALGPYGLYGGEISLAPNGDIMELGGIGTGQVAIAAYLPNGTLDSSFGIAGDAPLSAMTRSEAMTFQPNGQIVVIGSNYAGQGSANDLVVVRLNADGSVDTSFGPGGSVTTPPFNVSIAGVNAVNYLPGGLILAAGVADSTSSASGLVFNMLRYIAPHSILTPTITWANPADITAGTPLGAAQLDATASVAGSFIYTPAAGTVLSAAASQSLAVNFTPADATDYTSATDTVRINVKNANQTIPTITWSDPKNIVYGTALSGTQLDATASVAGTFVYSPAAGTILSAGPGQALSVTFTPTDMADFTSATATVPINVDPLHVTRSTPTITWSAPAGIIAGTPLGAAQLDATAAVPGAFTYTPAAGTILTAGANQSLAVTFTPSDTADYSTAAATVLINVNPSILPPPPTPPHISGIVSVTRTKKGLTAITIGFDEAMDSASVANRALYSVLGAVKKRKKTVYTRGVAIKGISFDGNSHVTIKFAKPYKGAVEVMVLGGILAADGASSSGDFSAVVF